MAVRASQSVIQTSSSIEGYQELAEALLQVYFVPGSTYYESRVNVSSKRYIHLKSIVTVDRILAHLRGEVSIAASSAYKGMARWVCMDIDSPNSGLLRKIRVVLKEKGLPSYVSLSGGGGYHFILFLEEPVPIFKAQEISVEVERAAIVIGLQYCKISPSPYGQGGDCIKLPLGVHPETGNYCPFLNDDLKPVEDNLSFLSSIQTVKVGDQTLITSYQVNKHTGEIITEFPDTISPRTCINKLWREGIQAQGTRHSATCAIANSIVRTRLISEKDKEIAITDWVYKTYPRAQTNHLVNSDMEYAIKEALRMLRQYQQRSQAELCEIPVFKAAMRSACENEFDCKLIQNHGYTNFRLLLKLGVFNAANAKPPGIGKSGMAVYLGIELVANDYYSFDWKGYPAFSLSTQQLICLANCTKPTVIEHRKRLINIGLLYKIPIRDIPPDVLRSTHPSYRNSFYALPEFNEETVRAVLQKLRSR